MSPLTSKALYFQKSKSDIRSRSWLGGFTAYYQRFTTVTVLVQDRHKRAVTCRQITRDYTGKKLVVLGVRDSETARCCWVVVHLSCRCCVVHSIAAGHFSGVFVQVLNGAYIFTAGDTHGAQHTISKGVGLGGMGVANVVSCMSIPSSRCRVLCLVRQQWPYHVN